MKLFISILIPEPVIQELISLQEKIAALNVFTGSYIRPELLHCTLFFIGTLKEEQHTLVQQKFEEIAYPQFEVTLGTLGFNSLKNPHVLWITLHSPLLTLFAELLGELFPEYKEPRAFTGHITLARIKKVVEPESIKPIITLPTPLASWLVDTVYLQNSYTTHEGPLYTTLSTLKLL